MRTIWYGESIQVYDLAASCSNCAMRHIARFPCGQKACAQAMCPYCGVGGMLEFLGSKIAALWAQEADLSLLFCAAGCGRPIDTENSSTHCIYCNECWNKQFLICLHDDCLSTNIS